MKLLANKEVPLEIEELLSDSIKPIKLAYFEAIDEFLNLECSVNFNTNYHSGKIYGPYDIKPILRVLLLKSKIIDEKSLVEIFKIDEKEVCIVLNFESDKKSFLVINLEELDYFKDKQLTKVIIKNIDQLILIFKELKKGKSNE